ncbi:MAG: Isopropylmalate/citramalate isomerase large subunit [Candidatus Heimdallarchaeota archaeon LC_3]|nr:MAG: Isopropylmalate/citramalate isomerase large subunit [Candidatus Heimdallarchaeota archaeon LC_3]
MKNKTFSEKIFSKKSGKYVSTNDIVFASPDWILSHDNSASIYKTFKKMKGEKIKNPEKLFIVLDHDAPPTNSQIANDHESIRSFVKNQDIKHFQDVGMGICHQLISDVVLPGDLIVGSDSHTSTSGALNTFAAGIDRTETAGLWLTGSTWFRVPETIKIILEGKLSEGVYAKDIALWLLGTIGSSGANYRALEFHGESIKYLSISERMTITNLAAEMGAKTAIFPPDRVLLEHIKKNGRYVKQNDLFYGDSGAEYSETITVDLNELTPLIAAPHNVDNVKSVSELAKTPINQAFLGTCTNARVDDIKIASEILKNKKINLNVQFIVAPASKEIYLESIKKGYMEILINSGATVLTSSCGPCLGKGQGIPADNWNIISTANRNFLGRMGNKKSSIFLASPATVVKSAVNGYVSDPRNHPPLEDRVFEQKIKDKSINVISSDEVRYIDGVWNYADVDNLNTDQMFAGNLTYDIKSSDPEKIVPFLFKGIDENFSKNVKKNDILVVGENFGCGSSREHPAVGLKFLGIKGIVAKSVARIFYRSAVNQGLAVIINPKFVNDYKKGSKINFDFKSNELTLNGNKFTIPELPDELKRIFESGGLINYYSK